MVGGVLESAEAGCGSGMRRDLHKFPVKVLCTASRRKLLQAIVHVAQIDDEDNVCDLLRRSAARGRLAIPRRPCFAAPAGRPRRQRSGFGLASPPPGASSSPRSDCRARAPSSPSRRSTQRGEAAAALLPRSATIRAERSLFARDKNSQRRFSSRTSPVRRSRRPVYLCEINSFSSPAPSLNKASLGLQGGAKVETDPGRRRRRIPRRRFRTKRNLSNVAHGARRSACSFDRTYFKEL